LDQFVACFEGLEDPRTGNAGLHDFHELLMIALCAVLCGGQGATHMAAFAMAKEPFLRSFLKLENGLPSHDTFSRLFRLLDPGQFRAAFQRFMAAFSQTDPGVVAIDGKALRRSFDRASGRSALHMVSAWGCEQRLVLGQVATDAKSNEITAVPKLLEMLSLKGAIVTTDALNCQRTIARHIVDPACPCEGGAKAGGGDYALALKGNQGSLHDDVRRFLDDPASNISRTDRGSTPGFGICCLRFTSGVTATHARLASGWRAAPLPGGCRTLWSATKGFRSSPFSFPGLRLSQVGFTPNAQRANWRPSLTNSVSPSSMSVGWSGGTMPT
jgi:predicted transposase YbfD/YdcC